MNKYKKGRMALPRKLVASNNCLFDRLDDDGSDDEMMQGNMFISRRWMDDVCGSDEC